jgi:hypothetical protein
MEVIILMPILLLLCAWLFSAFRDFRAAQVGERAAYTNLMMRLDNRAVPTVDGLGRSPLSPQDERTAPLNSFMAVRHLPLPQQQGSQADVHLFRIDNGSLSSGPSNAASGEYHTKVGLCFYEHGSQCSHAP